MGWWDEDWGEIGEGMKDSSEQLAESRRQEVLGVEGAATDRFVGRALGSKAEDGLRFDSVRARRTPNGCTWGQFGGGTAGEIG
jgi:hypothetical protein